MMILPTGSSKASKETLARRQVGFSLVEVMICVVILSLGLFSVNQTLLRSLSSLHYIETRFEANRVAENKIWEIQNQALHQKVAPGSRESGTLLGADKTFEYEASAHPIDHMNRLYKVRFVVRWLESGREKALIRNFYIRFPYVAQS
jgi:prepilin-type N-terminal cleavage/methylation domain-containing protein